MSPARVLARRPRWWCVLLRHRGGEGVSLCAGRHLGRARRYWRCWTCGTEWDA